MKTMTKIDRPISLESVHLLAGASMSNLLKLFWRQIASFLTNGLITGGFVAKQGMWTNIQIEIIQSRTFQSVNIEQELLRNFSQKLENIEKYLRCLYYVHNIFTMCLYYVYLISLEHIFTKFSVLRKILNDRQIQYNFNISYHFCDYQIYKKCEDKLL